MRIERARTNQGAEMTTTITLASSSKVSIQGNFSAPSVAAGTKFDVVLRTERGPEVIGRVTAQKFSTQQKFATTVLLPAGSYAIGSSGRVGDVFFADDAGSPAGHGASDVTSTLSFGVDALSTQQVSGARG
jgi:hypothetical protein